MPIDQPEATAEPTNRRAFLARAAMGGALVGVGAAAGPFGLFSTAAGAQDAPPATIEGAPELSNGAFAAFAVPLVVVAARAWRGDWPGHWPGHWPGKAEGWIGGSLALAALAGAALEGPANLEALGWSACALLLAARDALRDLFLDRWGLHRADVDGLLN